MQDSHGEKTSKVTATIKARLPPTAALIAQAITARFAAPAATVCALAAHGGTYRASDNSALRRFCGDNLRASEKTAPTAGAAATPDSAETKALTLSKQAQANHTKSRFWKEFTPRGVWRGLR